MDIRKALGEGAPAFFGVQSSDEPKERINAIAVIGAVPLAGLYGVSDSFGFRLRAMRKILSGSSQGPGETQQTKAEPTDAEHSCGRHVVTHTPDRAHQLQHATDHQ